MTSTDLIHDQPLSKELQGISMSLPDIPTQTLSDEAQGDETSILECMPEVSTSIRLNLFFGGLIFSLIFKSEYNIIDVGFL